MNKLLVMSATEIAREIRQGNLSPVEVLEAHIERIEKVNPILNAVILDRFDLARKEAVEAEERVKRGDGNLPPLLGVPCTIKDNYAMAGFPWSIGIWNRKDLIPDFSATAVERLQAAGAIILGRTNVPEGCMWCETFNTIYGRTNNPYDRRRTCGGSSGGEGAIVAAGGSPFGLAADVGGSIRFPSAFNGAPGHKPTGGLVPGTACDPQAEGPLAKYCTYGPIARKVEDLKLVLSVLAGPDGKDLSVEERGVGDPDSVDIKRVNVYYYDDNGLISCDADVKRAVSMAAQALKGKAESVQYWRPEGVGKGLDIWQAGMAQNPHPYTDILGYNRPISLFKETLKFLTGRSKLTYVGLITALIEKPGQMLKSRNKKFLDLADRMRDDIEEKLGDNGVIICPVFPTPAPKHNRILLKLPGISYSGIFNILHFPATVMPIFHRADGLPVSVQIVSGRFNDHVTIAVAAAIEKVLGGWRFPDNL